MQEDIQWNKDLVTGNIVVDTQHRNLFTVCDKIEDDAKTTDIEAIMGELFHYAESHFKAEEQMMASVRYPELVEHRRLHAEFIGKLKTLEVKAEPGTLSGVLRVKLMVKKWLKDHIVEEDMKWIQYYKDHSKKES